jgi:hypothetical protein
MPACHRYVVSSGSVSPGRVHGSGGLAIVGAILLISGVTSGLVGEALRKDNVAIWRLLVLAGVAMAAIGLLCGLALLVLLLVGRSRRKTDLSDAELEWGLDDWMSPLRSGWRQRVPEQQGPVYDLPKQDLPAQDHAIWDLPERRQPEYSSPDWRPQHAPGTDQQDLSSDGEGWHAGRAAGGMPPDDHRVPRPASTQYSFPPGPPGTQPPYPPAAHAPDPRVRQNARPADRRPFPPSPERTGLPSGYPPDQPSARPGGHPSERHPSSPPARPGYQPAASSGYLSSGHPSPGRPIVAGPPPGRHHASPSQPGSQPAAPDYPLGRPAGHASAAPGDLPGLPGGWPPSPGYPPGRPSGHVPTAPGQPPAAAPERPPSGRQAQPGLPPGPLTPGPAHIAGPPRYAPRPDGSRLDGPGPDNLRPSATVWPDAGTRPHAAWQDPRIDPGAAAQRHEPSSGRPSWFEVPPRARDVPGQPPDGWTAGSPPGSFPAGSGTRERPASMQAPPPAAAVGQSAQSAAAVGQAPYRQAPRVPTAPPGEAPPASQQPRPSGRPVPAADQPTGHGTGQRRAESASLQPGYHAYPQPGIGEERRPQPHVANGAELPPRAQPGHARQGRAQWSSPAAFGEGAADDTCPLPVILPGSHAPPNAQAGTPGPEGERWHPPGPARPAAAPGREAIPPGPDPGRSAPGQRLAAGQDAEAAAQAARAKLDQLKDLYLTAEAIGEDALVRHFDQVSERQRDLIREYFKQSGLRPSAILAPPDDNPPHEGPAQQAESATHST